MNAVLFAAIADALAGPGWIVVDDFIDGALAAALNAQAQVLELVPARIGNGPQRRAVQVLRSDRTRWIEEPGANPAEHELLARLGALRLALNRSLFAGLESFECHYAHYAPDAHYQRHLDRFRDDDRRLVSCVLYLNPDWQESHGGALRLYDAADATLTDVLPRSCRFVVFLSDRFPHEVLPATRDRYSIAAWFLRRAVSA